MEKIILSSDNEDKIKEIKDILKDIDVEILSKKDVGLNSLEVIEDGRTLEANALKKAKVIHDLVNNYIVIADDTGLFVNALNGEPGIYSGRYSGEDATYDENNQKLLEKMKGLNEDERKAYFMTVAAIIDKNGREHLVQGVCKGKIAENLRGTGGFGYDPLFIPNGYDKSFRELGTEEKNKISHRKKALEEIKTKIREIIDENSSS
jgi:XTP/dITP diphosphohydrolase